MKKIVILLSMLSFAFSLELPKNHLVSSSWLEKNQTNKNLVIIDTRKKEEFKKGHLKNSVNYPKKTWFQGKVGNIPKLNNSASQTQEMFQKAGITEDSFIIFYSSGKSNTDFADAASALYTAWIYGLENVAILDGGYTKWQKENKTITKELYKPQESDFEIESYNPEVIASLNDVISAQYNDEIQLADTRTNPFYTGAKGRKDLARKGRVPTAKLTPIIRQAQKVDNYYILPSKKEASKLLNNSGYGLELDQGAIFYCNTAHKARGMWFISKFIVGMEDVKVYEASMVEFTRTSNTMETGEAMD